MAGTYQSTNPRAATNPLRSISMVRPAHQVLGWTEDQKSTYALQVAHNNLAAAEAGYAAACAQLGEANKAKGLKKAMRPYWVAQAFRTINMRRAGLRHARAALAAALAAAPAQLAS